MLDGFISILLKKNRLIKIAIVVLFTVSLVFYKQIGNLFVPHKVEYHKALKTCENSMNYAKLNNMFSSQITTRNKIGNSVSSLGNYNDYVLSHIERDKKILYICIYQSDIKKYIGYTFSKEWDYIIYTTTNIDNKKGYTLHLSKVSKERKTEIKEVVKEFVSGRFNIEDYMSPHLEQEMEKIVEIQETGEDIAEEPKMQEQGTPEELGEGQETGETMGGEEQEGEMQEIEETTE